MLTLRRLPLLLLLAFLSSNARAQKLSNMPVRVASPDNQIVFTLSREALPGGPEHLGLFGNLPRPVPNQLFPAWL